MAEGKYLVGVDIGASSIKVASPAMMVASRSTLIGGRSRISVSSGAVMSTSYPLIIWPAKGQRDSTPGFGQGKRWAPARRALGALPSAPPTPHILRPPPLG